MGQVVWSNAVAVSVAMHTFLAELIYPSPERPSGNPGPPQHWRFHTSFQKEEEMLQGTGSEGLCEMELRETDKDAD